jgi:hypothetical protein
MLEMSTSGLMSGEGKRIGSQLGFRHRALPRLYHIQTVHAHAAPTRFKRFDNAVLTISGIELAEKIKKGQFKDGQARRV